MSRTWRCPSIPTTSAFAIWEDIIERDGIEAARRICAEEDDFGFIRNHLSARLATSWICSAIRSLTMAKRVLSRDIHAVREAILGPKYNYGARALPSSA
jgi:stage V sporulation protein R